jgi:translation machinery-associated protein 16
MPKSLEKTRKKIAKKKGNITALHENSRDSQRLRRAQMRDDKLEKVASARRKNDQPLSKPETWIYFTAETDFEQFKERHSSRRLFVPMMASHWS